MAKFECKELAGDNLEVAGTKFFKLFLWSEDGKLGLNKELKKTFISARPLNHATSFHIHVHSAIPCLSQLTI